MKHLRATADSQDPLTAVEKFTYLKGRLEGPAADCIQGFSLTSKNYEEAKQLLEERFGNPIPSAHMDVSLKLPKLNNGSVSRLSSFYNTIESNICSLLTMGLNPSHYGPLLIPVILERLPDAIKLLTTRKLGKSDWKILELVDCIKEEVDARENCKFSNEKLDEEYCRKTTHSLVGIQKSLIRNCVFCRKSHYCDKWENITDIAMRKKILREEQRCFKCFLNGHVIKNCRANYKCFNCQRKNHHTAICDRLKCIKSDTKETEIVTANDGNKNDDKASMLVDAKTDVLLHTADCIISNPSKTKSLKVKVLLDAGSRKTYLSDTNGDVLQLDTISKQSVQIKAFRDMKGQLKELGEYKFVLRGDGLRIYSLGFSVPVVCGSVNGQKVKFVKSDYPFLKNLKLADEGLHKKNIDLMTGTDFYLDIVDGSVKRGNGVALVALGSKLVWLLSDPVTKHNPSSLTTHVENNILHIKTTNFEERKVGYFWKLDLLGIQEKELSVCEKVMEDIKFENNRYVVKLPFKEMIPFVSDNYDVSLNRLSNLKNRLSKSIDTLVKYDKVITDQLEHGVIEKVESIGIPGKDKYLPHQAVIRDDHSSTKLRVVFDASSKTIGPSLNDILHKGPCLTPLLFDEFSI